MDKLTKPSRHIGPEDVCQGDYVTIAHKTYEFLRCGDDHWNGDIDISRVTLIPYDAGEPLQVVDVCLPYVLTRRPDREFVSIDLRRHHLAKLSKRYGAKAFACMREKKKKKK